MAKLLGEFAHRHIGNSYTPREGGGLISHAHWEGVATGFGTVFGTLRFDVPDGAKSGKVEWFGQAYPPDTPFVNGSGTGTWKQVEGAHRWKVTIPVLTVSSGERLRCVGQVDLLTRTFTGKMYEAAAKKKTRKKR